MYWHGENSCEITLSHKLAQDKPTVTWRIPVEQLGLQNTSIMAADYCLRQFIPYIDDLNAALYNHLRPDNENGKYYLDFPAGEILKRNTAFFLCAHQKTILMKVVLIFVCWQMNMKDL